LRAEGDSIAGSERTMSIPLKGRPAKTSGWGDYIAHEYDFASFPPGSHVLDVGFGPGTEMRAVIRHGCTVVGIEYDHTLAVRGRIDGLTVCRAAAESLPFTPGAFDGVMCKVVIPYTDEATALAEIARVLRPGGVAHISYHGLGYSLRYLLTDPNWKRRVSGARTIVNTHVYRRTGRRLPGFWGDTIYQAPGPLRQYYRRAGLELVEEHPSRRFGAAPVFIYHTLRRTASGAAAVPTRRTRLFG
jgi:SAM-dependent methyltransferase